MNKLRIKVLVSLEKFAGVCTFNYLCGSELLRQARWVSPTLALRKVKRRMRTSTEDLESR